MRKIDLRKMETTLPIGILLQRWSDIFWHWNLENCLRGGDGVLFKQEAVRERCCWEISSFRMDAVYIGNWKNCFKYKMTWICGLGCWCRHIGHQSNFENGGRGIWVCGNIQISECQPLKRSTRFRFFFRDIEICNFYRKCFYETLALNVSK